MKVCATPVGHAVIATIFLVADALSAGAATWAVTVVARSSVAALSTAVCKKADASFATVLISAW